MQIISHRGGSGEYQESSTYAFISSSSLPIEGIECDIHFTKDCVPIINHNPTLNEHHNIDEFIENLEFTEILSLTENKVILLSDLLEIFNPVQKLFLEIKGSPTKFQINILYNILEKYQNIKQNIVILSYNFKILKNIKNYQKLILIDNVFTKNILKQIIEKSESNYIGIYYDIVSKKYIDNIKKIKNDIKIYVFTVNELIIYKKFIDLKITNQITGIITDYPNKFNKFIN